MKVQYQRTGTGPVCFSLLCRRVWPVLACIAAVFAAPCLEPVGPLSIDRTGGLEDGLIIKNHWSNYNRGDPFSTDGMEVMFSKSGMVRILDVGEYTLSWEGGVLADVTAETGTKKTMRFL